MLLEKLRHVLHGNSLSILAPPANTPLGVGEAAGKVLVFLPFQVLENNVLATRIPIDDLAAIGPGDRKPGFVSPFDCIRASLGEKVGAFIP